MNKITRRSALGGLALIPAVGLAGREMTGPGAPEDLPGQASAPAAPAALVDDAPRKTNAAELMALIKQHRDAFLAGAALLSGQIDQSAAALADALRQIHGGRWSIEIDHDDCFVLIAKDLSAGR